MNVVVADVLHLAMKTCAVAMMLCMFVISRLDYLAAGDNLAGHVVVWILISIMAVAAGRGRVWRSPRPLGMGPAVVRVVQVGVTALSATDCGVATLAIAGRKPIPTVLSGGLLFTVPLFLATFVLAAVFRRHEQH